MGKYNSRKKKLIALTIIVALQAQSVLPCCAAAVTPNNGAIVNNRNNVPVVDIVKPNASGLSHNKFTDFNVGKEGLVFNNVANGSYNSVLAGQIAANNNLNGTPAKIILNEVTGGNISQLAGMMEIAGTKADLIIANPNGIVGNGFGFINTKRATLTTGTPIINKNTLTGFNVTGGTVEINGAGSSYPIDEVTGQYQYQPVSKLDIYANAAKINAELWAHDEINVIAGKNQIDYNQNTGAAQFGSAGSGVNLDVGALGGMYAGKIMLVGTNSGLGVNVSGNIAAQDSLSISNNGKITFNKTTTTETTDGVTENVDNVISSGGSIAIDTYGADIENSTNISAQGNVNITAGGKLTNSGKIIAGEEYEAAEGSGSFARDDANLKIEAGSIVNNQGALLSASNNLTATIDGTAELSGSLDAVNNLDIKAGGIVTAHGSLYSDKGNVIVAGEKVNTYDENLQAPNGTVTINETDPDVPPEPPEPEPPREAEEITTPDISGTSGVAGTEAAEKVPDEELALVADPNADGIYKPIIDHAANGVDLVQIAQVNANGVSRNLYSDFNIKSSGLILNNATEYTKTQLGGYIDRNMFLAGNGARVILNEVTSSRASVLNGYLEVAGHKASVVIANATGTSTINAGTFTNKNETTFHTGTDANITADTMVNTNSAMDVQGNLTADIGSFTNEDNGYLGVEGNADFSTGSFTNQSLGNIFVTGNLTETSSGDFMNEDGLIAVGGSAEFNAKNFTNQNDTAYKQGSVINAVGDITINAEDTVLNRSSNIESQGDINITANDVINKKDKFVTDWDITYEYISYKIPHLNAPNYYDAMREFERTIHTGVIKEETDDANIIASGNINIKADNDVINHYSKIAAGKDLTVEAGNTVQNVGYQGTIHHDDLGRDNHYWKYKKHKRFHIGCHYVYGTTVIPYEDHNVYDQEQSDTSERLSVMSGTGTVKIVGQNGVINKTLEADGKQYEDREKTVSTEVTDKLDGKTAAENNPFDANKQLTIDQLQINSKIYTLNEDPSADYLVETNPKYADYHEFLSSDYLLERVKADPEKVSKRLGDGYFEQQFVLEQVLNLTGKKYLDGYGSDMEQFRALMEAGAVAAEEMGLEIGVALTAEQIASLTSDIVWLVEEEINGQKVLVPEVYLAAIRDEDLKASGALITGGEVELYSKQDIENIGTINADRTVDLHGENIKNLSGDITGTDINLEAKGDVLNKSGNIAAENNVNIKADNIANVTTEKDTQYKELHQTTVGNTATITAGGDLRLDATDTITDRGGLMAAEGDLSLNAGNDIDIATVANEKHVAVAYGSSSAEIHNVENQQSILSGDNVSLNAGGDVNLSGTLTSAAQNTEITAGSDINVSAVKDLYSEESEVGHRGGSYYNHNRKVDETVIASNITGKGDIGLNGENNINIKGSNVTSEEGKISLNAGNEVNITAENEYHERLHEKHEESSGIFSSKSTDVYDYSNLDAVVGSNISGGSVDVTSGADTNITASTVVADNDVNIKTGGELNIGTQEQTSESEYIKKVKKSGIFAGGGFGITIGSEKQRDEYANKNVENVGSTVGSIEGSVTLEAKDDANITGSEVIAGKDINITGKNVNIESSENIYNAHEEHEYKLSGLTISVGGTAVEAVQDVIAPIERANQVEDNRLSALYGVKAGQEAMDIYDNLHAVDEAQKAYDFTKDMHGGELIESIKAENAADLAKAKTEEYSNPNNWNINIGFGTQHSESESDSTTIVNQGSNIKAEGDVTITSTEEDINIKGSNVEGENVTLDAAKDLNVTASKDSNVTEQDSESSSANIGVSVGTGGLLGVNAGYSKGEEDIDANSENYNESTVTADKELDFTSGEDTNIVGGKLSGEKVTGNVGGDLNIESKQDSNSYNEESKSGSLGLEYDLGTGKVGITGGYSEGNIDSDYASVTDQSGIYAGNEGFDIYVEDNTDLKGGIISGDNADKNKLSTGTLTYEDIKNEAEYEAGSTGVNVNIDNGADYNEKGVTPNIGMPAEDEAESTTKATVSEGEIEIRDKENQKQDLAGLNRDTQNALNKLGEIFDKDSIEERQELAGLFGELAYNQIHFMEGTDEQKAAYHALVGGIMAELTNGDFLAGASAAAVNKLASDKIMEIAKGDPAMAQWLSAAVGSVVSEVAGGNAQSGASIAASGMKYNYLNKEQFENMWEEVAAANGDEEEIKAIFAKYKKISDEQKAMETEKSWSKYEAIYDFDENGNVVFVRDGNVNGYEYDMTTGEAFELVMDKTKVFIRVASPSYAVDNVVARVARNIFDTSSWADKEFRSFVVGGELGKKGIAGVNVTLGYAMDKYGNVYKITGGTFGANLNSKGISINKILDVISLEITKDLANVNLAEYNNPKTALKDAISGLNGSISVNAGKIQFSTSDGKRVGSGITTDTASINISVTYIDPIE